MTPWVLISLSAGGLFGALMAAIAARSIQGIAWHELQKYCHKRDLKLLFDEIHAKEDEAALATETTQIIGTLVFAVCGIQWFGTRFGMEGTSYLLLLLVTGFAFIIVSTVWIPREIATWFGPSFLVRTWAIWRVVMVLLTPIGWMSRWSETVFLRAAGNGNSEKAKEKELEDEILSLVMEGQHEKSLDAKLREMIEGVIKLDDLTARDIMRHKSEIDAISLSDTWSSALDKVIQSGRTRIPVFDKNLDDIRGTLYAKDLLRVLGENRELSDVRHMLRESCEIPETMSLHELLKMFLTEKTHLAIVIDEFNATLGLVTIEDILEEIVGEIVDEDEPDEEPRQEIITIRRGCYLVAADVHLDDINEELETEIPSGDDYNTLGGFLIIHLRDIPKIGTVYQWNGIEFKVEDSTNRQVKRVRMDLVNLNHDNATELTLTDSVG